MTEDDYERCLGCDGGYIYAYENKRKDKQPFAFRCWCLLGSSLGNTIARWRGRHSLDYTRIKDENTWPITSTEERSLSLLKDTESTDSGANQNSQKKSGDSTDST